MDREVREFEEAEPGKRLLKPQDLLRPKPRQGEKQLQGLKPNEVR
ncbi:hypothetical protein ACFL2Q_02420 [Thermodesulfobacteriota bacterium]